MYASFWSWLRRFTFSCAQEERYKKKKSSYMNTQHGLWVIFELPGHYFERVLLSFSNGFFHSSLQDPQEGRHLVQLISWKTRIFILGNSPANQYSLNYNYIQAFNPQIWPNIKIYCAPIHSIHWLRVCSNITNSIRSVHCTEGMPTLPIMELPTGNNSCLAK